MTASSNPQGWKVGQEVLFQQLGSCSVGAQYAATITKVGRKYGEVVYSYKNDYAPDGWLISRPQKFSLDDGYNVGQNRFYRVTTPEALAKEERWREAEKAMKEGGLKWGGYGRCPLTTDQLERIAAILNETKETPK